MESRISPHKTLVGGTLCGFIFGDQKNRFKDGQKVTTSHVKAVDPENNLVYTLNTTYKVIDKEVFLRLKK